MNKAEISEVNTEVFACCFKVLFAEKLPHIFENGTTSVMVSTSGMILSNELIKIFYNCFFPKQIWAPNIDVFSLPYLEESNFVDIKMY